MTIVCIVGCLVIVAAISSISAAPPQTGFITLTPPYSFTARASLDFHPTSDNSWMIVYYKSSIYSVANCSGQNVKIVEGNWSATIWSIGPCLENDAQGYFSTIQVYNTSILAGSYLVRSCCFVSPAGVLANSVSYTVWKNITSRPDNGVVNSSPVTNMVTFLNVQRGCQVSITIPVWDPDGDIVLCTLVNITSIYGIADSQSLPMFFINEKTCRMTLIADITNSVSSNVEYYIVPIRILDFAWNDFSTPMTDVPLYFTASVYTSNASCDNTPQFIEPTPADGSKIMVRDNVPVSVNITVSSTNELYSITLTVDKQVSAGDTTSYTTESGVISWRNFNWTSSPSDIPVYIMCLSATDKITGQDAAARCIYFVRFVQDEKLFPYGLSQGEEVLENTDDSCSNAITVEEGVPIFGKLHRDIYVCANGIISFEQHITNPTSIQGATVLEPYYSDIDLKHSGRVFYSSFNLLQSQTQDVAVIIESMKSNITLFDGVEDYNPTFLLIATWHMAQPFRTTMTNEEATFQLVLITDGELTYVMYLYGKMKWHSVVGLPSIRIGYSVRGTYQETNVNSFTKLALNITENVETLGVKGMLLYKLTNTNLVKPNYEVRCLKWYNTNSNQLPAITAIVDSLPQCPCDMVSLFLNPWFSLPQPSLINEDTVCSDVWPAGRFRPHGKSCCYNTISGLWTDEIPFAGSYYSYHPNTFPKEHTVNDKTAKSNCCVMSNLCNLFYKLRPIGTCEKTQQNRIGTTWGDPHFKTLDNKTFTFNGLGEFVLLKVDTFTLQARTERAMKADGNLSDATIFAAFAAEDSMNASVQIELKPDRNGVYIYGNRVDLTRKFYEDHEVQGRFNFTSKEGGITNLVITSGEANTTSIFFPSDGIALNISVGANMLSLTTVIPSKFINKTSGLIGNYDGDANNDFQTPDGEIRDSSLTERELFEYGMLWSVTENTSVFVYPHGKTHADFNVPKFQPRFLDEAPEDKLTEAKSECGSDDNIECIFDLVFTESLEIALNTNMAKAHSEEVSSELSKRTPHLAGCDIINVSVGDTVICPVTVDEHGELSFHLSSNNSGVYFNETEQTIVYVQTTTDPVDIRLTVENKDEKKSPEIRVGVILCSGCSNHGTCLLNVTRKDDRNTESFKYAKCECWPEYQGLDCEEDFDGCASKPCSHGRQCVDLPADEHKYRNKSFTCGQCPTGFLEDGDKCVDLNECELRIDNCDHICTNTDGSFACSCNSGYRKDQSNAGQCNDINECDEAMSNCEQMCVNTDGGFNCTCLNGYALLNETCVTVNDVCANATEVNCSSTAGCTLDEEGNPGCFCNQGYKLVNNGTTCEDIDECLQNVCPQTCKNYIGGFQCSCYAGFELNEINECEACEFPYWGVNCDNTCQCSSQGTESCSPLKGCVCKAGWRGISCREDIDECMDSPGICDDVRKVCSNTNGSYTCKCANGFQLNSYGICKDINECSDPTLHDCAQVCSNTEGGYSCSCEEGYTEYDNSQCQDIDECAIGQSGCEQSCENFQGFYNCYCYFGFVLNEDRRTCRKVSDPCETYSNLTCAHLCFVEDDIAECRCNLGYELNTNGETCADVNECTFSNMNICNDIASCTNTDGSYLCVCPSGYKLQNDGRTCIACDKFHYGVNCQEECSCLHGYCNNIRGCVCNDGWSGSKCDVDINECLTSQYTCTLPNSVCTNTPGNFSCRCKTGFELTDGKCQDVDECADVRVHNCSQICTNTIGSYVCSCEAGFLLKQGRCSDINECSGVHGCEQYCENTVGSYRCTCKPGFKLSLSDRQSCTVERPCSDEMTETCNETNADCFMENEEQKCQCRKGFESIDSDCVDIKECSMEPCDQECVELEGGYSCECTVGFHLDTDNRTCIVCPMGFYGIKCEQVCNCNTSNTMSCDPVYGTCVCELGWQGITCEDDIDECSNDTACDDSAQCSNSIGSYQCRCPRGYVPTSDGICEACDDWKFGNNCDEGCDCEISNSASCNNIDGSCVCLQGWEGPTCDVDIDECSFGSCPIANSFCSNTPGSFMCHCLNGFVFHNAACVDYDECASAEQCLQDCENSPGTYQCVCYHGFHGNGYDCEECPITTYGFNCSEECICNLNHTIPHNSGRLCDAENGTCFCNSQWTGVMCDEDVNECADSQVCAEVANAGCHNILGGFACDCYKGYSKGSDGVCKKDEVDTTVNLSALDGLSVLHLIVSFDIRLEDGVDLNVSPTFSQYALTVERSLKQFYRERLGESVTLVIIVTGLRRGSLVGDYGLGFEDTGDVRSHIFSSVISLSRGTVLKFSDQNVTTNNMAADTTCGLFTSIVGNCGEDQECVEEESGPVCRDKKTGDFFILVIVLSSVGGVSLLVVSIGICVRCLRNKTTNDARRNAHNAGVVEETGFKPPGMRKRGMTWRRIFLAERGPGKGPLHIPRVTIDAKSPSE